MKNYPITGTFIDEITYDIPSSNWSYGEWQKDLDYMKQVGMDTLVFIRGGLGDQMIYPSKVFTHRKYDDFAEMILLEAAKRDMKVYFGMYISNLSWNNGDAAEEIRKNKLFTDEVCRRYGDIPSFCGWYIPHETCFNYFNISEVFSGLSAICKDKTPEKQVLISPFFKSRITHPKTAMTPDEFYEEWDGIFDRSAKDIDICAFQDGTAPLESFTEYFTVSKRLCDKYGIKHWVNVETFERDVRQVYYPITFDLLRRKLELIEPLAEKAITFEFSHFLSPQSIYPSAHNLFNRYTECYGNRNE